MFEGFTTDACEAVNLGQREASQLDCPFVGIEHILLGLLLMRDAVAAQTLESLGVTYEQVRRRFLNRDGGPSDVPGPQPFVPLGQRPLDVPFAPAAKRALEMSVREALTLGSASIDTEHILLGIIREPESPATRILTHIDAELPREKPVRQDRQFDLEIRNALIRRLTAPAAR
jgi:ATP-dependent Clp protease ATP-binding subunit ClpC